MASGSFMRSPEVSLNPSFVRIALSAILTSSTVAMGSPARGG